MAVQNEVDEIEHDDWDVDSAIELDDWTGEPITDQDALTLDYEMEVANTYYSNWYSTKKIVVNRGGTRSSKTYSICQILVNWLFTGWVREEQYIESGICNIVRKNKTTIKVTVQKDFEEILFANPLSKDVIQNKTTGTVTYQGRVVQFVGADEEQKMRGLKSTILYCNEANELVFKKQFSQLLWRTTDLIFIDMNPSDPDIWVNTEIEQKRAKAKGDVDVIVSTYKDNPFLPKSQIEEIEYLKLTDPDLWRVYGEGEYGKITGLVYDIKVVKEIPDAAELVGYALDFGFTNDPSTLVQGWYLPPQGDEKIGSYYMRDLFYEKGLTNPMLAEAFEECGLSKDDIIYADSAEPKSIAELNALGWNVHKVKKPSGSLLFGISVMKSNKLYCTEDSVGILKERGKYKWIENKETGELTNKPVDAFNHALDAARYLAYMRLSHTINKAIFNHYNSIQQD